MTKFYYGEKPWSSGLGRGLMTKRSWVRTLAPYTVGFKSLTTTVKLSC
jgi:hypothetical protein